MTVWIAVIAQITPFQLYFFIIPGLKNTNCNKIICLKHLTQHA